MSDAQGSRFMRFMTLNHEKDHQIRCMLLKVHDFEKEVV
jgi:hypothetical protein